MIENDGFSRHILHTSDLHLASLGDDGCQNLAAVVDLAGKSRVDLIVVAGDLFDNDRIDDNLVRFAAGQLKQVSAPVVILPGNHDCLVPNSAYRRENLWQDCQNVKIIKSPQGETLEFPELKLALWGKCNCSYEVDTLPLVGVPPTRKEGYWHLALAHGYYVGSLASSHPVFPSYHISREDIIASGCDYVAMGHLVEFRCVCDEPVPAYYSGSPDTAHAVAMVELKKGSAVRVSRHRL